MQANRALLMRSSALLRTAAASSNGPTFMTGGTLSDELEHAACLPVNERGIKSSSMFHEPNTAIYDASVSWTYLQPQKVNVEKFPAPEAKYYQRLTRKPWDISTAEWVEITHRKKTAMSFWYFSVFLMAWFVIPKEKSYSGLAGTDGFWVLLPKNEPELFN